MDELIAWLHAQLDEDERVAQASLADRPWGLYPDGHSPATIAFLDLWNEERALAEVEAKRLLLGWATCWLERDCAPWNKDAIHMLALPYADRLGYREEWRA